MFKKTDIVKCRAILREKSTIMTDGMHASSMYFVRWPNSMAETDGYIPMEQRVCWQVNGDIKAAQMLVVWDKPGGNGTDSFVMRRTQALAIAEEAKLDLVMIDPSRSPPVCKLMDYRVEQYRQRMKEKARKGKKQQVKEVQIKGLIAPHDLERKMSNILKYLGRGDVVKVTLDAPMTLLRRNLHCLEDLQAKLEGHIDPKLALVTHGRTSNKLTRREMMIKPKKAGGSGASSKGTSTKDVADPADDEDGDADESRPETAAQARKRRAYENAVATAAAACARIKAAAVGASPAVGKGSPGEEMGRRESLRDVAGKIGGWGGRELDLEGETEASDEERGEESHGLERGLEDEVGGTGGEEELDEEVKEDEDAGTDGLVQEDEMGEGEEGQDAGVCPSEGEDVDMLLQGGGYLSLEEDMDSDYDTHRSRKKRKEGSSGTREMKEGLGEVRDSKGKVRGRKSSKRGGDGDADDEGEWGRGDDDEATPRERSRRSRGGDGDSRAPRGGGSRQSAGGRGGRAGDRRRGRSDGPGRETRSENRGPGRGIGAGGRPGRGGRGNRGGRFQGNGVGNSRRPTWKSPFGGSDGSGGDRRGGLEVDAGGSGRFGSRVMSGNPDAYNRAEDR